jgi:hypothetical protein
MPLPIVTPTPEENPRTFSAMMAPPAPLYYPQTRSPRSRALLVREIRTPNAIDLSIGSPSRMLEWDRSPRRTTQTRSSVVTSTPAGPPPPPRPTSLSTDDVRIMRQWRDQYASYVFGHRITQDSSSASANTRQPLSPTTTSRRPTSPTVILERPRHQRTFSNGNLTAAEWRRREAMMQETPTWVHREERSDPETSWSASRHGRPTEPRQQLRSTALLVRNGQTNDSTAGSSNPPTVRNEFPQLPPPSGSLDPFFNRTITATTPDPEYPPPYVSGSRLNQGGELRFRPIPNPTEAVRWIRDDPPGDGTKKFDFSELLPPPPPEGHQLPSDIESETPRYSTQAVCAHHEMVSLEVIPGRRPATENDSRTSSPISSTFEDIADPAVMLDNVSAPNSGPEMYYNAQPVPDSPASLE